MLNNSRTSESSGCRQVSETLSTSTSNPPFPPAVRPARVKPVRPDSIVNNNRSALHAKYHGHGTLCHAEYHTGRRVGYDGCGPLRRRDWYNTAVLIMVRVKWDHHRENGHTIGAWRLEEGHPFSDRHLSQEAVGRVGSHHTTFGSCQTCISSHVF